MPPRQVRPALAATLALTLTGVSFVGLPTQATGAPRSYQPQAIGRSCTRWVTEPRTQSCRIYSPSMRTTITVDLQLPLHATSPLLHVFGGMWQHEHQGMLIHEVGGLARALSRTDVGFVAPVAPTNGSMWTDWRQPTLISDKKPIKWETFFTQELPTYLWHTFGIPLRPRNAIALGVSMGGAGGASVMYRHPEVYRAGYFLSGFYNFTSPLGRAALGVISGLSGNTGQDMWAYDDYAAHSPTELADRTPLFHTRFVAGTGMLDLKNKEINYKVGDTLLRLYGGTWLEAGMSASLVKFRTVVRKQAPQALRDGKAVIVIYPSGVHFWNLWRRDMYDEGGLQDILHRSGVRYAPVANPAQLKDPFAKRAKPAEKPKPADQPKPAKPTKTMPVEKPKTEDKPKPTKPTSSTPVDKPAPANKPTVG